MKWLAIVSLAIAGVLPAAAQPVFEYKAGGAQTARDLAWDLSQGLRIEIDLAYGGHERGQRLTPFTLSCVDGRGKPARLAFALRDDTRLWFYLEDDTGRWRAAEKSPASTTDVWVQGEAHYISASMDAQGKLALFTDDVAGRAHYSAPDREFLPVKATSLDVNDSMGQLAGVRVWLGGQTAAPRANPNVLPMTIVPPPKAAISPDVGLPLAMNLGINDPKLFDTACPRLVVECPEGVAPYRHMTINRVFFGPIPYAYWRKDKDLFQPFERDGVLYTRYTYNIPRTPAGAASRAPGLLYQAVVVLRSNRPQGDAPPLFAYMAWNGGQQPPARINLNILRFPHGDFRFKHIPAAAWPMPVLTAVDIPNYCRKLGLNRLIVTNEEDELDVYSPMLQEMRQTLGPDVAIDFYSTGRIWYRNWPGAKPFPDAIAFRDREGKINNRRLAMAYRGPEWFEDAERARQMILRGYDGISFDIEEPVYKGCFHPLTIERFTAYIKEKFPKLAYVDPHVFEADPAKHPELHEAWIRFNGSLMAEYYQSIREGMERAAKETKRQEKLALSIYNDERFGRAGADLSDLFAAPDPGGAVQTLLAPPQYRSAWQVGDSMRDCVKKFPNAFPAPYLGRPTQSLANQEHAVYEAFANGARGFFYFAWSWNDGRETQEFAQGLGNIHKIEAFIARSRILDAPFDLSDTVRVRAVGEGDEKFILVAQHADHASYLKKPLQQEVAFAVPTQGAARVVDLRTGATLATINPGANTVTLRFTEFGVFPLHIKPVKAD